MVYTGKLSSGCAIIAKYGMYRMFFYADLLTFLLRFMAYTWTNSIGKYDEAMSILKAGMEANPSR